ncbi:hypothetical protein IWQ62_006670, partial [Dispira parvispora]
MPKCTHRGCEKEFAEETNGPEACHYHPGKPLFHEGLKGWDCCSKRVVDFDDFLKIPGCATGSHVTKPAEKVQFSTPSTAEDLAKDYSSQPTSAPSPVAAGPTTTTHGHSQADTTPKVTDTKGVAQSPLEELGDPDDAVIPPNTICRHRGCGYRFVSNQVSRGDGADARCVYHPGVPIFHEGSKGWSCCKRRVLEFDEFMKIKGCQTGHHVFLDNTPSANELKTDAGSNSTTKQQGASTIQCRRDWYQTQKHVIVSIFAKKIVPAKSTIQFHKQSVHAHLELADGN